MTVRTLGPGSLKIGETASAREWAGELTKTSLEVDTSSEDPIPVLDGTEVDGEDSYAYALKGSLLDRFDRQGLQAFAETNKGLLLPFVWTPNNSGDLDISGTVKIRPINWGGDVKKKNANDFEFTVIGGITLGDVV